MNAIAERIEIQARGLETDLSAEELNQRLISAFEKYMSGGGGVAK